MLSQIPDRKWYYQLHDANKAVKLKYRTRPHSRFLYLYAADSNILYYVSHTRALARSYMKLYKIHKKSISTAKMKSIDLHTKNKLYGLTSYRLHMATINTYTGMCCWWCLSFHEHLSLIAFCQFH